MSLSRVLKNLYKLVRILYKTSVFSNFSEHSRHWFFRGKMVVDEKEKEESLIKMVMSTQKNSNNNNVIKFNDNSRCVSVYY